MHKRLLFRIKVYSDYRKIWRDVISQHPGHSHGYKLVMAALLKANIRMVYLHKGITTPKSLNILLYNENAYIFFFNLEGKYLE